MFTVGKFLSSLLVLLALFGGWWFGVTQERNKSLHSSELHNHADEQAESGDLYTCSMHPQVIQDKPGTCPICGMELVKMKNSKSSSRTERKIKHYWDPMMNPPYISDSPGKSPMGMDLIPVYEDAGGDENVVTIEPQIVQNMGVRLAKVKRDSLSRIVRAAGYLTEAESSVYEVNLLVSGWIRKLSANATGMRIEKGAPLFELYSPDVQVAIAELIAARKDKSGSSILVGPMKSLYQNTLAKLERWGLTHQQVEELAKRDSVPDTITIQSPIRGYVAEKNVVEGASVGAGTKALKLVDYSMLWLDAQVFAQDLPFVQRAEKATLSSVGLPGTTFLATVSQAVLPVDKDTRAATIRLDVQNPLLLLRPGMFVNVDFSLKSVEEHLLVPRSAIIDSGARKIVFVSSGSGNYEARDVSVGLEGEQGLVQVLSGLSDGEEVVTSGQFLLDSESRLEEAIRKFAAPHEKTSDIGESSSEAMSGMNVTGKPSAESDKTVEVGKNPISRAEQSAVDKLVSSYLEFSRDLGAVVKEDRVFDSAQLTSSASSLSSVASNAKVKQLAGDIQQASIALEGKSSSDQRENFKKLSSLMIKLVSIVSPSPAIANSLYLFHCPMADADWLQSEDKIANPYYSSSMKSCGELVEELKPTNSGGASKQ